MALRGAVVSHDKWHLCILNVFGALATLTLSPEGGLSTGRGLKHQPQLLHQRLNADRTEVVLISPGNLTRNASLICNLGGKCVKNVSGSFVKEICSVAILQYKA